MSFQFLRVDRFLQRLFENIGDPCLRQTFACVSFVCSLSRPAALGAAHGTHSTCVLGVYVPLDFTQLAGQLSY